MESVLGNRRWTEWIFKLWRSRNRDGVDGVGVIVELCGNEVQVRISDNAVAIVSLFEENTLRRN